MSRKLVILASLSILLFCPLYEQFRMGELKASSSYLVHNVDTGLNYTSIREALDAPETVDGHNILVDPGTYYELVRVNKSVSLIGKNKTTTIIDGNRTGTVINVTVDNVYVSGFTIRNSSELSLCSGIFLGNTRNTTIVDNIISGGDVCIFLEHSRGNSILNNTLINLDGEGICLTSSSENKIIGNNVSLVKYGITLEDFSDNNTISDNDIKRTPEFAPTYGIQLYLCNNNTISNSRLTGCGVNINIASSNSNVVVGNSVTWGGFYNLILVSSSGNVVADNDLSFSKRGGVAGAGVVIWEGGNNNIVRGNTLSYNLYGVSIRDSSNNVICDNIIRENWWGVLIETDFKYSSNNTIYNNLITENSRGIGLYSKSENSRVYDNNFIDNNNHAIVSVHCTGFWDNGVEGNYWSNYTGVDSTHDGIGDTPHIINANNTDRYPLMGVFSSFNTSLDYNVDVISNSTIEEFEYFNSNSTIRMHVSNSTANQTYGFCRLCIPKTLMPPPYTVVIDDGLTEVLHFNNTIYDNATHRWIYFAYPHSTREIHVIPELPSIIIMPLLFIATFLLAATIYGRKRCLHLL